MASFNQRPGYPQWVQALRQLQKPTGLPNGLVCYGSSSYLILKTQEKVRRIAREKNFAIESHFASSLSEADFLELLEQDGLFTENKLVIINQFQSNSKLIPYCEQAFSRLSDRTKLLLICPQDKLAPKLKKQIPTSFGLIPCFTPSQREISAFISDLAKFYKLYLNQDCRQLLALSLGQDLFKIENEIKNLSLLFPDSKKQAPTAEDLSQALGSLREDHGFRLEEFILTKQTGKALNLLDDLIKRGESSLAILGILASHCRKAIEVLAHKSGEISADKIQIPAFIQQKFLRSLSSTDKAKYTKALRLCHEADIMLKTSKTSDLIPLSSIILTLTSSKAL